MQLEFDDGTLLLRDALEEIPYGEWDDRVDEYRAQAYQYRALLTWAGVWTDGDGQTTLTNGESIEDTARVYPGLALTPALHIEPRDYQQAALDAWIEHGRQGSVVLPTGSGKTFLGLQAIADAGVSALVVTPTISVSLSKRVIAECTLIWMRTNASSGSEPAPPSSTPGVITEWQRRQQRS